MTPEARPKRPYTNLEDFRRRFGWVRPMERGDPTFWPCLACEGRGSYQKVEDLDPIEGYKLAPRYRCPACNGTRRSTKKACREAYRQSIHDWQAQVEAWLRTTELQASGLAKLTNDEKWALGIWD